jgi:hypothetical protein
MGGPSWLAWILASVMIATAVYCLTRLLASWRQHRPTDRPVDLANVLMGVAMAGMLVARLRVFWVGGWEVVFGIGTVWFAGLTIREHRGQAPRSGHHLQHVLACGAMLYMFLAQATVAQVPVARAGGSTMGAVAAGPAHLPTLALALAFALFGYVVWNADRLSSLAPVAALAAAVVPVPVLAGAGAGGGASFAAAHREDAPSTVASRPVPLSPRLAVCCEIVMGVTMGYALILML